MTDWKFSGERRPRTPEEWEAEFDKYRKSPEFRLVNSRMTVDEFKFIYWMEYGHRTWGRLLGAVFLLPATYFVATGALRGALARRVALLFAAGGTQGLVGWWMVRSGLGEQAERRDVPRVSPYRLASHLASAMAIYAGLVWTCLDVLRGGSSLEGDAAAARAARAAAASGEATLSSSAKKLLALDVPAAAASARRLLGPLRPAVLLVAVTALSGAFVAGNDAGRAYNTFPDMNGEWIPEEYWTVGGWRNAFESTAAVQLHHRLLAYSTLAATTALAVWSSRGLALAPRAGHLVAAVAGAAWAQAALGVTTLLLYVPVELGSAHQTGALVVLTGALAALHAARRDAGVLGANAALGARYALPATVAGLAAVAYAVTNHE